MLSKYRNILIAGVMIFSAYSAFADGCQSAAFSFSYDIPNCTGQFLFQGTTDCGVGQGNSNWIWDFGDGSPQEYDIMNPTHEYLYEGAYTVTLWMYPLCHGPGNPPCINTATINVLFPNLADIVPVVTSDYNGHDVSCTDACDGTLIIASVGPGYSIEWGDFPAGETTITGVCPGTYYVYSHPPVGCGYTQGVVTVENPPPFDYTFSQDSMSCYGQSDGIATVIVTGATPGYQITWSNGATGPTAYNLPTGSYTINIVDANGCEFIANGTLLELPQLFANAFVSSDYHGFDISCYDGSDGAADANPSGGSPPYFFQWDDLINQTTQVATNLQQDDYHVFIVDSQGCTVEDSISLFHPTPVTADVDIISDYHGEDISCFGEDDGIVEVVSASGGTGNNVSSYTYQWYEVPEGCQNIQCWVSVAGATNPEYSTASDGTYVVSLTDLNNCTAYVYQSVEEPPPIVIDVVITSNYNGTAISCNGAEDGEVTYSASGGTGQLLSEWTNNGNTGFVNGGLPSGIYTVELTDANGCFASDSIFVAEPPPIVVTGWVSSDYNGAHISCFDSNDGILEGQASGGNGTIHLFWSNGVLGSPNSLNIHAGDYTLTAIDANSCHEETQVTVIPPPQLIPVITLLTDYNGYPISCYGEDDGVGEVTTTGGVGNYTYLWTGQVLPGQITNVAGTVSAGTLQVQATDENGCIATNTITVQQPPPVQALLQVISNYNGSEISCYGASDGSVQVYPTGGVPPYEFNWDDDPGETTNVITGLPDGITGIMVEDLNGCQYTTNIMVTQPLPVTTTMEVASDYHGSDTSCPGSSDGSAHIVAQGGTAPYFYLWPYGESGSTSGYFYPEGYVAVSVWDINNCQTTDSIFITTPSEMTSSTEILTDYNGFSVSCYGAHDGSVIISGAGGTGDLTFEWSNGLSGTLNDNFGAGQIFVDITDVNGCTIQDTVLLTQPPQIVGIDSILSDYTGWDISCYGYSDGIASIDPSGGVEPYSILWSSGETGLVATDLTGGSQWVSITDHNGCDTTYMLNLTEPDPINTTFITVTDTCLRAGGTALAIASGGTPPYAFLWEEGTTGAYITNLLSGSYEVFVTDTNGCFNTLETFIPNIPAPVAHFTPSDSIICIVNESTVVNFTDQSENNPISWDWDFSIGNTSTLQHPVHDFYGPGNHTVTLTVQNEFQCTDDTTMTIAVLPDMTIYLPNAFTPNNDGMNDTFYPKGTEVKYIQLDIFDRWGALIFSADSMDDEWDGWVNGYPPVIESYNYVLVASGGCDDKDLKKKYGTVTIVK
ncbi:MAG: gliding motility-associated C-terminal domain-containing protein [Crocinitomicaceae bacterium]|nr:gliding motility-associated C-terminal domain-containing protein [Crocinitomicaceae bacterium]